MTRMSVSNIAGAYAVIIKMSENVYITYTPSAVDPSVRFKREVKKKKKNRPTPVQKPAVSFFEITIRSRA